MPVPFRARFWVALSLLGLVVSPAVGETWEATLTPFASGSFPAPRPLHAHYGFGWSGFSAATADVRFTKSASDNYELDAVGGTIGVTRTLWRYDIVHTANAATGTLRPLTVVETEKTRRKETKSEVTYLPEAVISRQEEQKSGATVTKDRRFDFPNALSVEAALLFLRSQPMPDGATYRVVVYPATSAYLCTITVKGRERVSVPAGSYPALKLNLQLSKIGPKHELTPHKKFRNAVVWLSDDNDRLVLRIEAQVYVGKVFAELRSVEYARPNL
ncbi:MAG: DUF3108 domain-containing protein [Chthoniobacterales bacterium]